MNYTRESLLNKIESLSTQNTARESDEFDEGCASMKQTIIDIIKDADVPEQNASYVDSRTPEERTKDEESYKMATVITNIPIKKWEDKMKMDIYYAIKSGGDEMSQDYVINAILPLLVNARVEEREKFADQIEGIQETERIKERMRAFEILHKYAMKTKETKTLDFIEAMQKEIITAINQK